jgi:hypothetical protein
MGISGTSARTVEAWIQTSANADPNNGGVQQVITDWGSMTTGSRFTFNVLFNNGLRIEVQGSGLNSTKAINDGQWHHVAAVFDPNATYKYRLLVDGRLDTFGNIPTALNTASSVPFTIGRRIDNTNYFGGKIDEVRVFNFVRTDSAIKADMRKEFCSSVNGLTAYYKLNEGTPNGNSNTSKTSALDYSGNNNTGTLYNFTLRGTSSNWVNGSPVIGKTTASFKAFACSTYTVPSGKRTVSSSGNYTDTISNRVGCDSIMTIQLSIGKSNTTLNINACDSFRTPKGQVVYANTTITETYKSYRNCDSIINYKININHSSLNVLNLSACDSFITMKGKVIRSSGQYADTFYTINKCDSIFIYKIKINHSVNTSRNIKACDSIKLYNQTYSQSQTLKFVFKTYLLCDSIETILLTINKTRVNPILMTTCDSFISPKGKTYKKSGVYDELYSTYTGCDSIVRYQLTVFKNQSTLNEIHACRFYYFNGKRYDSTVVINEKLKTSNGCDSNVQTKIIITTIDTGIQINQNTLSCKIAHADSIAWLNCSSKQLVPNENKITFKPQLSGQYAAIIGVNNCFDTSTCYQINLSSINPIQLKTAVAIFPNPNTGFFNIIPLSQIQIKAVLIFDMLGQQINLKLNTTGNQFQNTDALSQGIYTILLETDLGRLRYVLQVL